MPRAISRDLRIRVVEAYKNGEGTYRQLAERFGVGEASVDRWIAQDRRTGDVTPRPQGGRRTGKIGAAEQALLAEWIREDPDVTLEDLQRRLEDEHGLKVHLSNVHRHVIRLGFRRKKKPLSTPRGRRTA
jgi:transposase